MYPIDQQVRYGPWGDDRRGIGRSGPLPAHKVLDDAQCRDAVRLSEQIAGVEVVINLDESIVDETAAVGRHNGAGALSAAPFVCRPQQLSLELIHVEGAAPVLNPAGVGQGRINAVVVPVPAANGTRDNGPVVLHQLVAVVAKDGLVACIAGPEELGHLLDGSLLPA